MRFKNYVNRYNKKNRIYSEEELLAMTLNDLLDNEQSILAQDKEIGIPNYEELKNSPNTRWIDPFVNNQGQKDGGFYGSINDGYYMFPHQEQKIPEELPYKNIPVYMDEGTTEEPQEEDNPMVLEGGVEENVYLPEEDDEQESEPSVYIPDEDEPVEEQNTPYELSDKDLTDILQSIIKAKPSANTQTKPSLENSFPTTPQTDTPNNASVPLPQLQTSLNQDDIKDMWKKILEELRKVLRASNVYKNGTYIGGASQISTNNLDNIFSEKKNNANNVLPQEISPEINNINKQNSDAIYENLLINPIDLPKYRKQKELDKTAQKVEFVKPVEGKITSAFGYRPAPKAGASKFHSGIDIGVPMNTPVRAIFDGTVTKSGTTNMGGYGVGIFVEHSINGTTLNSEYGHLSKWIVEPGQKVKQGQIIGYSGNSGVSTGPHLHLTIRKYNNDKKQWEAVNPQDYVKY